MTAPQAQKDWEEYRTRELTRATHIAEKLGYTLDAEQVHTRGERYLMSGVQDVGGGGKKLVLLGRRTSGARRVVVKFSTTPLGMNEIERERTSRTLLHSLDFALHPFSSPQELCYVRDTEYTILITEYIEEQRTLMEHSLEEQFFLALRALEMQEGVHATTSTHTHKIQEAFGIVGADYYVDQFERFRRAALANDPNNIELAEAFTTASSFITEHQALIDRYSGFLTHSDFSPQNLRIRDRTLYLLDYASLYFGNKYESWARFINFMVQHSPALERLLLSYLRENRGDDEYLCLRVMQAYKLGFLLQFWTGALARSDGKLNELVRLRIHFWTQTLRAVCTDQPLSETEVRRYHEEQARLRSDEEKARQKEILAARVEIVL